MEILHCGECGDYTFPISQNIPRKLSRCNNCKRKSVLIRDISNMPLEALAKQMNYEIENKRFIYALPQYRNFNYLLDALSKAKYFINITTESVDMFFLGMLALKFRQKDIEINIIIKHPPSINPDLDWIRPRSELIKRDTTTGIRLITVPSINQKLVVLDGYLAFKGNTNASLHEWTKQDSSLKFVTNRDEIQSLNRQFFSSILANKIQQA